MKGSICFPLSRIRELNPGIRLGKPAHYRYANPALRPRPGSNWHQGIRNPLFYPLNYGAGCTPCRTRTRTMTFEASHAIHYTKEASCPGEVRTPITAFAGPYSIRLNYGTKERDLGLEPSFPEWKSGALPTIS